jgi:hypothetical protein
VLADLALQVLTVYRLWATGTDLVLQVSTVLQAMAQYERIDLALQVLFVPRVITDSVLQVLTLYYKFL